MAFLVRSLAVITVLLVALVAVVITSKDGSVPEEGMRRKLSEDFLVFEDMFVGEVEVKMTENESADATTEVPVEGEVIKDDVIDGDEVESDFSEFLASPDDFDFEAIQEEEQQFELEMQAHEYGEAMMNAIMLEEQARYEEELAIERAALEGTPEAQAEAVEVGNMAEMVLEDAVEQESDIIQKELQQAQEFVEDSGRKLKEELKARGHSKIVLNGVTFDAEE
jgi:hypothetical protein